MLKALQKALGSKPEAEGTGLAVEAAVEAATAELRAEFEEFKQTAEALLAAAEENVASLTAQLEAANAKLAELHELAEKAAAEKAEAEAAALAEKLAARKEKVVAAIGTERATALLAATEGMDDAAFEAVATALGVSAAAEAGSSLFTEVGADAQANAAQVVESAEMRILKNKYAKK